MRTMYPWLAALCLGVAIPGVHPAAEKEEKPACSNHGTTIDFLETPKEAATQAKKEQKLVFVLHVSGNFEDPRFT